VKILFISRTASSKKNALNHRLTMLAEGLERLGHRTDLLYLGDHMRTNPPIVSPVGFPALLPRCCGYDAIHAGTAFGGFPLCLFKRYLEAPLIHDMHGDGTGEMMMKFRFQDRSLKTAFWVFHNAFMEEVIIHRADLHLVVSRPLRELLLGHGIPRHRIGLVRNGVDVDRFRPQEEKASGPFTVCYAGDFQVWQGVDLFMKALRRLSQEEIRFVFIGFRSTPDDQAWKGRLEQLLGPRARLIDRLPQEELIEQLRGADLLVLPRPYHRATAVAMPTKFAEYLALGKAVLVTEVDETARFVHRHRCGFVSLPTAEGLAEGILRARRTGRDELAAMGRRGRRLAEGFFSWEAICRRYERFLLKNITPNDHP
jgi:glycosyltransferase involved in cell wall biosynthesis